MPYEQRATAPLWLEFSGLPGLLAGKVRGAGWIVFRKIVELDCAVNTQPDTVETTLVELAERTGVAPPAVRKAIGALRKMKLVACFLPESDEETALLRVRVPLATPRPPDEIKAAWPRLFQEPPQHFRYAEEWEPSALESRESDPALQEIVDLYFNAVGLKMNAFVLDELALIRHRFPMDQVRRTFRRAQQNEIRSLHWVVKELVRAKRKYEEENPKGA